jgi:phospholipase C
MKRSVLKLCSAWVAAASLLQPAAAFAAPVGPAVTLQTSTGTAGAAQAIDPARQPVLSTEQMVALLRQRVKHVFVIFQENESFDHHFGSFPGANGLFSAPAGMVAGKDSASFTQPFFSAGADTAAAPDQTITPFRIGPFVHAEDSDDVDHAHVRMAQKMDLDAAGVPKMDRFALFEETKYNAGGKATLKGRQYAELAMSYVDCNSIPLMWNLADRFVLFDNIFQTVVGPSTPNAIAMIAGQSGDTQWVKHGTQISNGTAVTNQGTGYSEPVVSDPMPLWGAPSDTAGKSHGPQNPAPNGTPWNGESVAAANVTPNQTYASLTLTLAGRKLPAELSGDFDPATNEADIQKDIKAITTANRPQVPWGWYENGYDAEPNSADNAAHQHTGYIAHHNGPQYFGYVQDNSVMQKHLHGLGDFFTDLHKNALPATGGVYYIRGGYHNIDGLKPSFNDGSADANAVQAHFTGDDDHPGYSDFQISEAMAQRTVNAIARSKYWADSAIILTYDESEGDYDHAPPRILSFDPAGFPLSRGPRIPLLVISPFARAHTVSHEEGDHNSVIQLVDQLFQLQPLATLPEEAEARAAGATASTTLSANAPTATLPAGFHQTNLGPHDALTPGMGEYGLLSAFDPQRLSGSKPPLPASYAQVPDKIVLTLPHYEAKGCSALHIQTEDRRLGIANNVPADFNPRPGTTPGLPAVPPHD